MRRLGILASLLAAALAYAQQTGNASGVIIETAREIASPFIQGLTAILGIIFWFAIILTIYHFAEYVFRRGTLGSWASSSAIGSIYEHVKALIFAVIGLFAFAFIIGAVLTAIGYNADLGKFIINLFLRALTLGQQVFSI